jgi:hypothetical protein
MKAILIIGFLCCLTGSVALTAPCAYAQSEIDPDHFESPNTEPFTQPKPDAGSQVTEIRYEGRLVLPYSLMCSGNRLFPGEYSISLRSDGKVGQAILILKGQAIGIAGIVHRQVHKSGNDAAVVVDQGKIRTLTAIRVAELEFIFDPGNQIDTLSKGKPRRSERLPLTLSAPKKRRGTAG